MTTTPSRAGNRRRLPDNPLGVCASCLTPRGTRRVGWHPITSGTEVVGYTCPECPRHGEPIRREVRGDRVRFLAVVNGTPTPEGRRRQIKRRFSTVDEAREWITETREGVERAAKGRRAYTDPGTITVRALAEVWLAKRAEEVGTPGGIREVSLNGYRSALDAPLRHIGDSLAREVTADDVEALVRVLATKGGAWERGLSHRSIVYALASLRQMFAYGVRRGWLRENPAATVKAPAKRHDSTRRVVVWTPAELIAFRQHVDAQPLTAEPWLRAGMRLTLCGLRRSEVLGMDWQCVDLDAGTVKVQASRVKTGRGHATDQGEAKSSDSHRVVLVEAIHPGTVAALRALWLSQGRPTAGLVIRDAVGEPVQPDAYSRRFRVLSDGAEVPDLGSIHNVRHTIATALHDKGMEPRKVASLLGHKVTTHLAFYVPTTDAGAAEAAAGAGRLFAV